MTSTSFFFLFIPLLAVILLAINLTLAPHNPYQEKGSTFECGFHSFLGQNRSEFSVSFFIFGLLFLLFDIEILLIYPFFVSAYNNGIYGLSIVLILLTVLTVGFVFEVAKNALKIDSKQYNSSKDDILVQSSCDGYAVSFPDFSHYILGCVKIFGDSKYIKLCGGIKLPWIKTFDSNRLIPDHNFLDNAKTLMEWTQNHFHFFLGAALCLISVLLTLAFFMAEGRKERYTRPGEKSTRLPLQPQTEALPQVYTWPEDGQYTLKNPPREPRPVRVIELDCIVPPDHFITRPTPIEPKYSGPGPIETKYPAADGLKPKHPSLVKSFAQSKQCYIPDHAVQEQSFVQGPIQEQIQYQGQKTACSIIESGGTWTTLQASVDPDYDPFSEKWETHFANGKKIPENYKWPLAEKGTGGYYSGEIIKHPTKEAAEKRKEEIEKEVKEAEFLKISDFTLTKPRWIKNPDYVKKRKMGEGDHPTGSGSKVNPWKRKKA